MARGIFVAHLRCVILVWVCLGHKGILLTFTDGFSLFSNGQDSSSTRSFKFLYSPSQSTVQEVLDTVCRTVKPKLPWFSRFMLEGKICNWDQDSKGTEDFLKTMYGLYQSKIETSPVVKKAIDVIEARYLKRTETDKISRVMAVLNLPGATVLAENAIPVVQHIAEQGFINEANVEKLITLSSNLVEIVPDSKFLKKLISKLGAYEKEQQFKIVKDFAMQLIAFVKYDEQYSKPITDYKVYQSPLEHIVYKLVKMSDMSQNIRNTLTQDYVNAKLPESSNLPKIWKLMGSGAKSRSTRSLPDMDRQQEDQQDTRADGRGQIGMNPDY